MQSSQLIRDLIGVALAAISVVVTIHGLKDYLSSLSNPLPLFFVLLTSLFISILYDIKNGINRYTGIAAITTTIAFAIGVHLAIEYREVYLAVIADLKGLEGAEEVVGVEYIRAVDNPAVGLGACFAAGVATIRLPFSSLLRALLTKLLIIPTKASNICMSCGQALGQSNN